MSSWLADDDEHLTTGWEPDLPAADSLVRAAVLVHASWAVTPARALGRPWRDGPDWAAGYCSDRAAVANWAVLKQPHLDLAAVVSAVAEVVPDEAPYLLVSPFAPAERRPVGLGLGLVGHPPLMYRPVGPVSMPDGVEVRRAESPDDVATAERILVNGYPITELQPFNPGVVYSPAILEDPSTRVLLGYVDGEPVATAAVHSAYGVNLVESVAVMPAGRGRGAGAAVTAAATTANPGEPAVLIASDDGQPVYERLGYLRVERWTAWIHAAAEPVSA